jgi:demethylmenaquinone methyltransferase / 2-methoxy-6-polyprenyl-1,4-benzoquinol methylase
MPAKLTPTPASGSRPAGALSESDASQKVRKMFTDIAPTYDSLNHILSINIDRRWRARTAKLLSPILQRPDALVLDLCCGTGDLALAFRARGPAQIIGADFAHTMLVRARAKAAAIAPTAFAISRDANHNESVILSEAQNLSKSPQSGNESLLGTTRPLLFVEADALRLPFADQTFDLVATAFGFRNLANYEAGLREIHRVLKPGGTVAILEFTEPPDTFLGNLYRWYFRRVLPRLGAWLSGDRDAYTYLPNSVSRFFHPGQLSALLNATGYASPQFRTWTFGTVALHTALRPAILAN